MRTAFIEILCRIAEEDECIWLLTGDLGYSVLEVFANHFPDRFVNIGVAEQNMVGIAAGLALSGKVVFTCSIANFPTFRCLEQIRNDVCYHNADVKIVAAGGGLAYGAQGMTHHATEDLAIMRALPNMTVIAPGDPVEATLATRASLEWPGPCYLRLGKTKESVIHRKPPNFEIGKAITVREGGDLTLIATGGMLYNTVQAGEQLAQQGLQARVLSMHTLKPLDTEAVLAAARDTRAVFTIEEHTIIGGLGSAVTEVIAGSNMKPIFQRLGIPDNYAHEVGSNSYVCQQYELDQHSIVQKILYALEGINNDNIKS